MFAASPSSIGRMREASSAKTTLRPGSLDLYSAWMMPSKASASAFHSSMSAAGTAMTASASRQMALGLFPPPRVRSWKSYWSSVYFRVQEADEEPQGVRAFLVDVVSAVAAAAAGDADLQRPVALAQGLALEFEGGGGVHAAGAAHEELSLVLGIQVDEGLPFEEAGLQGEGAVHAGFLRNREQALELAGRKVAREQGEAGGDADAVVRAEGGVLGHHPAVLHLIGDRLGEEVEVEMGVLLAHHVLVRLENEGGNLFLAGGGFLDDHDVAGLVGPALEVVLRGEFLEESGHGTFVARFAGNPGDVLENVQYGISGHILACFVA